MDDLNSIIQMNELSKSKQYQMILAAFLQNNSVDYLKEDIESVLDNYLRYTKSSSVAEYLDIELLNNLDDALYEVKKRHDKSREYSFQEIIDIIEGETGGIKEAIREAEKTVRYLSGESLPIVIPNREVKRNLKECFRRNILYGDYIFVGNPSCFTFKEFEIYDVLQITEDGLVGSKGEIFNITKPLECFKLNVSEEDITNISGLEIRNQLSDSNKSREIFGKRIYAGDLIVMSTYTHHICYGLYLGFKESGVPYAFVGSTEYAYINRCLKIDNPTSEEVKIKEKLINQYLASVYLRLRSSQNSI